MWSLNTRGCGESKQEVNKEAPRFETPRWALSRDSMTFNGPLNLSRLGALICALHGKEDSLYQEMRTCI